MRADKPDKQSDKSHKHTRESGQAKSSIYPVASTEEKNPSFKRSSSYHHDDIDATDAPIPHLFGQGLEAWAQNEFHRIMDDKKSSGENHTLPIAPPPSRAESISDISNDEDSPIHPVICYTAESKHDAFSDSDWSHTSK